MNKVVRFIIFTVLVGGALVLALLSSVVYATGEGCAPSEGFIVENYHDNIICYVVVIIDQNETIIEQNDRIEEKLDWNNCALSHKRTYGYTHDEIWMSSSTDGENNYKQLIEKCGAMP